MTEIDEAERHRAEEAERRARTTQSFWTVAVGVPVIISVMRLVVEAGGELQTTLLLVANVNPVNLVAAFVTTSSRMVSALLILLFAISAVLTASVDPRLRQAERDRRPLMVRWKNVAPMWFVIVVIVVALATWKILYLPLLVLAVVVMFQLTPARLHRSRLVQAAVVVPILAAYTWLLLPTVGRAAGQREYLVIALLLAPAVLVLAVTGPIHPATVRPLATIGPLIMVVAMMWTAYSVVTTPVLPLTVTTIDGSVVSNPTVEQEPTANPDPTVDPDPSADPDVTAGPDGTPEPDRTPGPGANPGHGATTSPGTSEDIRGHVITIDDVHVVILQEQGGVRYVPVDQVTSQVLCPSDEELPRYLLWVHGFHIEDSLLEGLGRRERPFAPIDAACRIAR